MRIIIAGAGDLGFHLAKLLAYEEQDIILIDQDSEVLENVSNSLDVNVIKGSSTSISVLEEANVSKADLLIAVTSIEETNIATAIIGKSLGAKRTIARISNIEFLQQKEKLDLKTVGIDEIISPESLAAREIKRLLKQSALTDTFEFEKGSLSLIGITVDEDSELRDKTLTETAYLNPDQDFTTIAILRDHETIIPYGDNKFMLNDHAYFIAEPSGMERVMSLAGKESFEIKLVIQDKVSLELVSDLSNTLVQSNINELNKSKNENLKTKIFISDISLPTYSIKNNKFKAFIDSKNNGYFSYGSFFDNELKQLNFADGFYIYLELNDLNINNILTENDNQNTTNLKFVKLKIKELDFFDNIYTDQIFEINFLEDETYASFYGDNLNGNLRIDSSGFSRIDVYNTKFEFKGIDLIESNNSIKFDDINLRFVGKNIQTFNDIFQDIDFYLLRNKRVTTVDNIRISSENFNIGPTFDNEKAYISYDNLNDLYKIKGSYEINNQSDLFVNLINYDFKYLYSDLNIQWKSINQLKELEGKIKFKIKDLESNANLPDSALLRALRILNLNALVGNLSNDLAFEGSSLIVSRAEGDFIIGKNRALMSNPIKLETPEAKMNWKGEIIKNQNGLLDELDLDLEMRLKFSENIPWYAALFGGIPALAGGFVLENIIDERVDDASTFKFSVTGSIDDPKIIRLN